MLAVVTERTQEIGIRKSLGARDILNQYLVESSVLAGSGGFAAVCIAWLVAVAVAVRSFTSVPMALPWSSVVIGVRLAAVVGLFFGIYPARRAAKLDPIEALRVER
jgi:putative ABC transport system permease protein